MTRKDSLAGHALRISRRDQGSRHHGGYHMFATVASCTCGGWTIEIPDAPSKGGEAKAAAAFQDHVADQVSRDPLAVVSRARTEWRDWQPGDGTCYRVRVITQYRGPGHGDRVLLVSVARRTWAFQYPIVAYRVREMGPPDYRRSLLQGAAGELWRAVEPLLVVEGIIDGVES